MRSCYSVVLPSRAENKFEKRAIHVAPYGGILIVTTVEKIYGHCKVCTNVLLHGHLRVRGRQARF